MGEKNYKDPESKLTVNCNDVTYQYTNRNVSINKLFCMYTNADCLSNKLSELRSVIDSCDTHPQLIGVCEVKPQNCRFTPSATEFSLPGYSLFHSNVDTQIGRGVSLYISNILTATPIVLCDEFCESVWVTIPLTGSDKLLIGCIYRGQTQQCDLNDARLCNMLLKASNMKDVSHVLIIGDFNLPLINWSTWTCSNNSENSFDNTFINCLRDSFFHQHVTTPTRSRYNQNPSILDLILTNEEGMISSLSHLCPLGQSDHSILTFNFHCYIQHRRHDRIQYNYKKGDYSTMRGRLNLDWNCILNNKCVDDQWLIFTNHVNSAQVNCVPTKTNPTKEMTMNDLKLNHKAIIKIKKKHKLWKKFIIHKDKDTYINYCK